MTGPESLGGEIPSDEEMLQVIEFYGLTDSLEKDIQSFREVEERIAESQDGVPTTSAQREVEETLRSHRQRLEQQLVEVKDEYAEIIERRDQRLNK